MIKKGLRFALTGLVSAGLLVSALPAQAVSLPVSQALGLTMTQIRHKVTVEANAARKAEGLNALSANSNLDRIAQDWADHLSRKGSKFEHNPNVGNLVYAAGGFTGYGENIAAGYRDEHSVHVGWMNSPGHKANILNPSFNRIGVGYAHNLDTDYRDFWVQVFAVSDLDVQPGDYESGDEFHDYVPVPLPLDDGLVGKLEKGEIIGISARGAVYSYGHYPYGDAKKIRVGGGITQIKDLFTVDWNADGLQDILVQKNNGDLVYSKQNADGKWDDPLVVGTGWNDFDIEPSFFTKLDTYPALVAKNSAGELFYYARTNDTQIAARRQISWGWQGLDLHVVDYLGNGRQDIIAVAPDGRMRLYETTGTGWMSAKPGRQISWGWNMFTEIRTSRSLRNPGEVGLIGKTPDGTLFHYFVKNGSITERELMGRGWADFTLASS